MIIVGSSWPSWSSWSCTSWSRTTAWSGCGTASRTPGRRSTCSSSAATTSSRTWSRRSRATPPTRAAPSRRSSRPATWPWPPRAPPSRREAENMITGALKSVFALSEAYPDLKANQNFLNLQEELDRHRGPDRLRAAVLQRLRRPLQHQDPDVPGQHHRRSVQLHRARVLRGGRGLARQRDGRLRHRAEGRPRRPAGAGGHAARAPRRPPPPDLPPRTLTPACTTRSLRTSAAPSS